MDEEENMSNVCKVLMGFGIVLGVIAGIINNKYSTVLYIISYILIAYDIIYTAIKHLFSKDMFDENLIMTIATIGAMALGEYKEAILVIVLYKIGEILEEKAISSSKKKIEKLLDLKEEKTTLRNGEVVNTSSVKCGDEILVKKGDKVPVDGIVISKNAKIDMSLLNGESNYVNFKENDEIPSGAINVGEAIYIKVTKEEKDSTISKIVELVEKANKNKSKTEKYISKFCKIYTPVVILLSIIVLVILPFAFNIEWRESIYRALSFLVISCPCALVISIPLSFFITMGALSKRGIISKGTTYIDKLTHVDTIFFDKTGTLTEGKFKVKEITSLSNMSKEDILKYIAYAESKSSHVIAQAVLTEYNKRIDESKIKEHVEEAGHGIRAIIDGKTILCGNSKLLKKYDIEYVEEKINDTVIYLVVENTLMGYITLGDILKSGTEKIVEKLHKENIIEVGMLTGDKREVAESVAEKLSIDTYRAELLPQDKVEVIEKAKKDGKTVAFVGDGINDSPVIATSDVGIAMGKGTDVAIETADMVLMTDEPEKVVEAIKISKRTKRIVTENITIILIVKLIFIICSVLGFTSMFLAVFADVGVTLITIVNSLRIFNTNRVIKEKS